MNELEKSIKCAREGFVDEIEDFFKKSTYFSKIEKYNILRDKFDEHLEIVLELKGYWNGNG